MITFKIHSTKAKISIAKKVRPKMIMTRIILNTKKKSDRLWLMKLEGTR